MNYAQNSHFELPNLRRCTLAFVDRLESTCRSFLYWWHLLRDLCRSKSFPKNWLLSSACFSFGSFVAAIISVGWENCCFQNVEVPAHASTMAWLCAASALAAFFGLLVVLGKLLFPVLTQSNVAFERLQQDVPEFRSIAQDFRAKAPQMSIGEVRKLRRQIREELPQFTTRYRTLKRAQFIIVVFFVIFLALLIFTGLFLVDYVFEMQFNGRAPIYDHYQMESQSLSARLLSAFHDSVSMFVTMGIGRVESTFAKLISIIEVLFAAVMIFFGMNMVLAFYEQAMGIDHVAVMRAFFNVTKPLDIEAES